MLYAFSVKIAAALTLFFCFFSSPAHAIHNGSLGIDGGLGGYSSNGWPLTAYGISLAAKGERHGELAVGYTVNQITSSTGSDTLQQFELDLRYRLYERFGFYIGLPVNYFSSSNEMIIPSGVNLGAQLGYDFDMTDRTSVGIHVQDTFLRNYFVGLITFKLWAPRE
jgi:hypothetical protein